MSVFKFLRACYSNDVYIQVWENRLKVRNLNNWVVFDDDPLIALQARDKRGPTVEAIGRSVYQLPNKADLSILNPFSHPRSLINDFQCASKILMHAVRDVHRARWFAPHPRLIIHPMEKVEGGLTSIETRAFRELCLSANAREVSIYLGKEPDNSKLSYEWLRSLSS